MPRVIFILFLFASIIGCGNLSPKFNPKLKEEINNQGGQIEDLKSNQNGLMNEIGNINQKNEIQDSQLDRIQNGAFNNQNTGFQIFSGSGGLFLAMVMFILIFFFSTMHYRNASITSTEAVNVMAKTIVEREDLELKEDILKAASVAPKVEQVIQNSVEKNEAQKIIDQQS